MLALADVAVVVSDAEASARWWVEKLGFSKLVIGGSGHAVLVAPPGERFVLHLCEGFAPLEPGNAGIAFVTDEIDSLVDRMTRAGIVFAEPLMNDRRGKSAKFADPDGNIFWLVGAPSAMVRATLDSRAPPLGSKPRQGRRLGQAPPKDRSGPSETFPPALGPVVPTLLEADLKSSKTL